DTWCAKAILCIPLRGVMAGIIVILLQPIILLRPLLFILGSKFVLIRKTAALPQWLAGQPLHHLQRNRRNPNKALALHVQLRVKKRRANPQQRLKQRASPLWLASV